jgi:hypothetical protein
MGVFQRRIRLRRDNGVDLSSRLSSQFLRSGLGPAGSPLGTRNDFGADAPASPRLVLYEHKERTFVDQADALDNREAMGGWQICGSPPLPVGTRIRAAKS